MSSVRPSVVLLVAAALLTGCAGGEEPAAQPSATPSAPPSSSAPAEPGAGGEDLGLAEVDLCALLTEEQLAELGVNDEPMSPPADPDHPSVRECRLPTLHEDSFGLYSLALVPAEDADALVDALGLDSGDGTEIGGLPATTYPAAEGSPEVCAFAVDLAPDQLLLAARMVDGVETTAARTCEEASKAAEYAVEALLDL
ncbi:DUF3558 family protein [Actinoalloteichus caeruleus]|uniref:DUF3558 family protein n=2 Tax=Actinoalloteichus cyanogriseus TaxID=2893586 RepID=UPI0009DF6E0C|nr:DUF3558 family protein [Actinoalloteichus caeruleus]